MTDKLLDHLSPNPDRISVGADELTFRAVSDATRGDALAVDVVIGPGGGPPMLHRHDPAEIYRVDRGELAIYLEDADGAIARIPAAQGDVVPIAGGRRHTVRNESSEEARAYVVFTPGAAMEAFTREAATLGGDVAAVLALAERHGIEMTGPIETSGP